MSRAAALAAAAAVTVSAAVLATTIRTDSAPTDILTGNLTLVLEDDFDGDALDTAVWNTCHWWAENGCTISSNEELEWYLPSQVSLAEGALRLRAEPRNVRSDDGRLHRYTSGMVTTGPPDADSPARFDFTYGRVDVRLRVPAGVGLWAAIWLLPSDTESRPEIDAMEILGDDPSEWIFHLHPLDRDAESPGIHVDGPDASLGWHDLRLDWEPRRLRWFVDGSLAWELVGDDVPDEPMYLIANLAVGGEYPGPPDELTPFPADFEIERIRVWQPSP